MSTGTLLKNLRPAGGTSQAGRGNTGAPERHTRYGLLLVMVLLSYVLSAFFRGSWILALQIALFLGVSALAVQSERLKRRTVRVLVGVTIGGSIIAITLALTQSASAGAGVAYLWAALMLLFAVVLIVRRVLAQPEVSLQSIFGAVSAYVIIGLMFASVYAAINQFTAGDFFAQGAGNLKTFQYFSFTTLTTLGYGDYTAAQSGGQAVAVMEAMLGQIFLATLVARLVSAFRRTDRGHGAGSAATAGRARAGDGNQHDPAQPARPGDDPGLAGAPRPTARASPRARAREVRRSRLRSQR